MPNANTNTRSAGRMLLPSRVSSSSASKDESSGSSETSAQRRQGLSLTPSNTVATQNDSDDTSDFDSDGPETVSLSSVEHQSDLENPEEERSDREGLSEDYEDDAPLRNVHSDPLANRSSSSDLTTIHARSCSIRRSSSAPSQTLQRAHSTSPPPRRSSEAVHIQRKRAHFDDEDTLAKLVPSRCPRMQRNSCVSKDPDLHSAPEYTSEELDEVAAALEVLEGVMEELVQVTEEHAEAHHQLSDVARELADAIFESRRSSYATNDDDLRGRNRYQSHESDFENSDDEYKRPHAINHTSADDDVDESCFEDTAIVFEETDLASKEKTTNTSHKAQHQLPEVLYLTAQGEIKKPDLEPIYEDPHSSTETVIDWSVGSSESPSERRVSVPEIRRAGFENLNDAGRRASLPEFADIKGRFKLLPASTKSDPAGCVVTACSVHVAEAPRLNTIYENAGVRHKDIDRDHDHVKTAHTVRSDSGMLQMLWLERPSGPGSSVTLLEDSTREPGAVLLWSDVNISQVSSPMDRVKTKLAAWSWAKEHGLEAEGSPPNRIPLLAIGDEVSSTGSGGHTPQTEAPFAPPNTERPSGASSAKQSIHHSPLQQHSECPDIDEEEDDPPLELKARTTLSRSASESAEQAGAVGTDYLCVSSRSPSLPSTPGGTMNVIAIPRQLSNLAAEDAHFKTHKDSLILVHKRQEEGKMNHHLMSSRDSVILARSKLDTRYPKSASEPKSSCRARALSPIPDASPPDARVQFGIEAMSKATEAGLGRQPKVPNRGVEEPHPDEHADCSIYEVERPRWVEANCRKSVPT